MSGAEDGKLGTLGARETLEYVPRLVGRFCGKEAGPLLLVVAGLHGNEPAGIEAARRVFANLVKDRPSFRGELVVLAGNIRALARNRRQIVKDLNRQWTPEKIEAIRSSDPRDRDSEDQEMHELLGAIESELANAKGDAYFIDLHSTSAPGVPFILFGDTLRNRAFAQPIPIPKVLGLEEELDGTLLEYINNLGYVTMGCEGGRDGAPETIQNHESVIWIALGTAGLLDSESIPSFLQCREALRSARGDIPALVSVRYRHVIRPRDEFRMHTGFRTLQRVRAGELLATDRLGEVRARWSGWILMPLYQEMGTDGFFLAREMSPTLLALSTFLRRLRLGKLLEILPGVTRHRDRDEALVVDTRVARWFPLEVFRLFGFRKLRWQGPVLVVSRRRHDIDAPR